MRTPRALRRRGAGHAILAHIGGYKADPNSIFMSLEL